MLTPEEERKVQEETYARMRKDIRQQEEYRALVEPLIEVWGVDLADMPEIKAAGGFASFFA